MSSVPSSLPRLEALWLTCPDVGVLLLATAAAALTAGVRRRACRGRKHASFVTGQLACLVWISVLVVGGYLLVLANAPYNPRYLAVFLPELVILLVVFGSMAIRSVVVVRVLLAVGVATCLWNSHGSLYPSSAKVHDRYPTAYYLMERSYEYLDQQHSDFRALQTVLAQPPELPVYTERPYGLYLALPQLGFYLGSGEGRRKGWMHGSFSDFLKNFRHTSFDRAQQLAQGGKIVVLGRGFSSEFDPFKDQVLYRDSFTPALFAFLRSTTARSPTVVGIEEEDPGTPNVPIGWVEARPSQGPTGHTLADRLNAEPVFRTGWVSSEFVVRTDRNYSLEIQVVSSDPCTLRVSLSQDASKEISTQWRTMVRAGRGENWLRFDVAANVAGAYRYFVHVEDPAPTIVLAGASLRIMPKTGKDSNVP